MLGKTLKDRYLIEKKMGEGAMGAVYRALDQRLNRTVAIKVIGGQHSPSAAERFLREAHIISRLNHPHIMSIYDMDETEGFPFLVVEFIPGRTLLAALPDLANIAKLKTACQIVDALTYAHTQGIVHRDLKSSNVIVSDGDDINVKLLDFGLALQMDASRLTGSGFIVGTASYMAPEQATGGPVDARTDLYALGVILYEMFTGKLPFNGADIVAVLYQVMHMDPQPPKWLNPSLPDELNQLILELLNKTPDRRPNDADVMQRLQSISFEDNAQNPAVSVSSYNHSKSSIGRAGRGALVGRTAELTQIKGWIESAINGQCQLGLISGPAGIGKSRLVEEALIYARLRGMKVFNTRAYREDSALLFQPIINSLRPLSADVTAVDSAVQRLFNGETDDVESMSESMRRRINEGIIQYFKALATGVPLVFSMDDIHWADTASLNLILQLARSTTESRLLLIGTYSDDVPAPTGLNEIILAQKQDRLGVRISLVPFSRRETNEQLLTLFGNNVSDSFVERVYSETEGNPLYVEEIARWLVDEGIATRQGTHWSIEGTENWQLPPHLQDFMQGLVERRIKRIMRDHVMRKGGLDFATCIHRGKVHYEVFEEQLRRQLSHLATRRSVKEQVERYLRIADDIHIFVDSVNERLSELKQGDLFRVVLDVTQGGVMYYYLGEDSYIVGATTDQSAMDDNTADLEMRSMVAEIQDLLSKAGT